MKRKEQRRREENRRMWNCWPFHMWPAAFSFRFSFDFSAYARCMTKKSVTQLVSQCYPIRSDPIQDNPRRSIVSIGSERWRCQKRPTKTLLPGQHCQLVLPCSWPKDTEPCRASYSIRNWPADRCLASHRGEPPRKNHTKFTFIMNGQMAEWSNARVALHTNAARDSRSLATAVAAWSSNLVAKAKSWVFLSLTSAVVAVFFFYRCLLLPLIDGRNGNIQWAKFAAVDGDYDLIG